MTKSIERRTFVQSALVGGLGLASFSTTSSVRANGTRSSERPSAADELAITDTTVFDPRTKRHRFHQTVLITGGRITAVAPASELAVPAGSQVIEGGGRYLTPGFIDAHVHLTHVLHQAGMTGDDVLPLYLAHGVTTVRSAGDNLPAQRLLQRYATATPETCPRIFTASPLVDAAPPWHQDIGWSLTDPAAVPAFVAQMVRWGVTTIKLYVGVDREVGRRVIKEAHRNGIVVSGHLSRYRTEDAVTDGIDCLEHIYSVADAARDDADDRHSFRPDSDATKRLIDLIAARGVAVNPTLMVFWGALFFVDVPAVIEHPDNLLVPKQLRDYWLADNPRRLEGRGVGSLALRERTFARYQALVGLLHQAGVKILVGTDSPEPQVTPGASLHHEMELLEASGMSAGDVLAAATLENARILRQQEHLGTVEPGRVADLVLLDADPLATITNTRRIRTVVRSGVISDPRALLAARLR